ncbi:MAG: hypothetical protein ACOH5I_07370 [Oligoflexus sp.]
MARIQQLKFSVFNIAIVLHLTACGGYDAADESDLEPRPGEIVGVLVDERGKAHPDASIELYAEDATEVLTVVEGMDSDGRFGVFPPDTGNYSIVGVIGDTQKVIVQGVAFTSGAGQNIGKIATTEVAVLSVQVTTPEEFSSEGVKFQVLGYSASGTTIQEGFGIIESGIPAGKYKLRFSKEGLSDLLIENLELESGKITLLEDVEMSVAGS